MSEKKGNLAIITARSGSKGVPDKNIRIVAGKPLIAYTIEAAIKSNIFDEVMVSTDSEEYAEISKKFGAKVPFFRSDKNSADNAKSTDTIKEVLDCYKELGREFETVCALQPTSPLRNSNDIIEAYKVYEGKKAIFVLSVNEMKHTPVWSNTLDDNHSLNGFIKSDVSTIRQDIKPYYQVNGAIYLSNVKAFYENCYYYREGAYAYIMPPERSIDIDDEEDLLFLEYYFNKIRLKD